MTELLFRLVNFYAPQNVYLGFYNQFIELALDID